MENRVFLERYRLSVGRNGLPVELHRSPAARTYRAQEIETGREVALTLVSPAPDDPAVLEQLETEAAAAEKINQMNIPRLYDFGRENGELIYVDEYCEGHTAAAWVGARGPLPIAAVLRVALQVADAMNATAFQRLYHRALNPDNIIFVAGQTVEGDWPPVKMLHWFAPSADLSGTGNARVDSAARFASPEQLGGAKVDVRSEIYSLGATMWFLLTGVPSESDPKVSGENATRIARDKLRGVPKIVRHLLDRMLRADPAERPQDPVALAAYLQTCLARVERRARIERCFGLPIVAKPRAVEPRARPPIAVKPLAWAAGILALAALGLFLLPWPLTNKRSAPLAETTTRAPDSLPNEAPVVRRDSPGQMDETVIHATPALAARAADEIPRHETAPAATAAAAEDARIEIPRDELATTATNSSPLPGPPAPAEGPAESAPAPASVVAANAPANDENSLPGEPDNPTSVKAPVMTETNEPDKAAPLPAPTAGLAPIAEEKPKTAAPIAHPAEEPKSALTKRPTTRRKSPSVVERRSTRPRRDRHLAHTARRAQPLPKLRVGSAPAELVGTTSDGRWILSVESGRQVIVPPPPGFGP